MEKSYHLKAVLINIMGSEEKTLSPWKQKKKNESEEVIKM